MCCKEPASLFVGADAHIGPTVKRLDFGPMWASAPTGSLGDFDEKREVFFLIRLATEADVPEMLAIYAPYVLTTTYTFEYEVPTEEEFLARFRSITEKFPWLVWEEEGRILGYAYGSLPFERAAYSWCGEDSIYLRPEAKGRGIGRKLLNCLENLLQIQGYRKIYAIITSENTVSLDFHRKNGYLSISVMENCGYKFGRWLGVTWMEKELPFVPFSGIFPTPFPIIMQSDEKILHNLDTFSLP